MLNGHIPLLEKEGWMRGQSEAAKLPYSAQTGWSYRRKPLGLNIYAELTTPAAPFRNGSILLVARPPLLFKEGNSRYRGTCYAK
jgi:hypothetical protein